MNQQDIIGLSLFIIVLVGVLVFSYRASRKSARSRAPVRPDIPASVIAPAAPSAVGYPVLTIALIVASVLITLHVGFGKSEEELLLWIIVPPESDGLASAVAGEPWRLITPAFIHFNPLHLLFNMVWLWDLGRIVERRKGRMLFGALVLVIGVLSNVAQYLIGGSPYFGGMSGVVYGLLGYFWVQGRINPAFGYSLNKQTVVIMLGWFVLCWTGLLGPIANWAHTAGLVAGVAWGYAEFAIGRRQASDR